MILGGIGLNLHPHLNQRIGAWCRPKTAHTFRHHAL